MIWPLKAKNSRQSKNAWFTKYPVKARKAPPQDTPPLPSYQNMRTNTKLRYTIYFQNKISTTEEYSFMSAVVTKNVF
jgi:hypothetical protein